MTGSLLLEWHRQAAWHEMEANRATARGAFVHDHADMGTVVAARAYDEVYEEHRIAWDRYALGRIGLLGAALWLVLCTLYGVYSLVWRIFKGAVSSAQREAKDERTPCPQCGESIPVAARICRFCKAALKAP